MQLTRGTDRIVFFGTSLNDVANWLAATPAEWRDECGRTGRPSDSWDLGVGYNGALQLAKTGWGVGSSKLYDKLRALPPPVNTHTKLKFDVAGHYPDVGRFAAGQPDHMLTKGKVHGKKPTVHVICNMTASASISAQEYLNFGTALCAIVDKLEASGRRVQLDVTFANALRIHRTLVGWNVKQAGEPLDLSAVAFSLAHPAAYRRLGFAMWERTPLSDYSAGHGQCTPLTKKDAALIDGENALILNGDGLKLTACRTPKDAVTFVADQLNRVAGETLVETGDV